MSELVFKNCKSSAVIYEDYVDRSHLNYYEFVEQNGDKIMIIGSESRYPYETVVVEYIRCADHKRMKIVLPNRWVRHAVAPGNDICPRCGNKLIILTRHKNEYKDGFRFVGCSNYPKCTYRRSDSYKSMPVHKHYKLVGGGSLDIDELYDLYGGEVF